jgi:hypothetical protein
MANKFNTERIYVESSFSNILIVNPNKVYNDQNFPEDRLIKHEELVMYANLQCNLQPRSRLLVGEDFQTLQTIATTKINFLKPNGKEYLSTSWTDIPGVASNNSSTTINSELLGITNINYKATSSYISTVDIQLEDIRGRALFESGNESIYSAFFNLPYPTFYLTIKGYYGKAIKYPLILQKFQASFDSGSGNFLITLNFVGYKYNVLTDIAQSYLYAVPNMYAREVTQNLQIQSSLPTDSSISQINGGAVMQNTAITYIGYDKIKEMFEIYKQKKLIDDTLQPMTIHELVVRLDRFESEVLKNFGSVNLDKLTDAKQFKELLNNYVVDMYSARSGAKVSWKFEYIDEQNYFITNDGKKIFTYKPKFEEYDKAYTDLEARIKDNNTKIADCPTFGANKGKGNEVINVNISVDDFIVKPFPIDAEINFVETARQRLKKQNLLPGEENEFKIQFSEIIQKQTLVNEARQNATPAILPPRPIEIPFFYVFDGEGYFNNEIARYNKILSRLNQNIEEQLTEQINELLKSNEGIGFNPTIRNILGIIFASADAFLRLMDEVHTNAFNVRDDQRKKQSVLNDVQQPISTSPVYPWPEFTKEIFSDNGELKYEIKYPGDEFAEETGAVPPYSVWPEVEFVEEFVKGLIQRQQLPLSAQATGDDSLVNRALISGFDLLNNKSYSVEQDISFLYEILERVDSIAYYDGFVRNLVYDNILNLLQAYEASNILIGIGLDDANLVKILKEENDFNINTYVDYLFNASNNGTGQYYQNLLYGNINTPYLKEEIIAPSRIIKKELPQVNAEIRTEPNVAEVEEEMKKYLEKTDKNEIYFSDTFPFVIPEWNLKNLYKGGENSQLSKVLNTNKTLFFNTAIKKIVNFPGKKPDIDKIRPFYFFVNLSKTTDFNSLVTDYITFYKNRYGNIKELSFTEGDVFDDTTNLDNTTTNFQRKTNSILNSPLFINSIQIGVEEEKSNTSKNPYVRAAYLFLNSLPLSRPGAQYIDNMNVTYDYIGTSMKKYGAIHSLPKMWICKIGAVWHRYKNYIQDGTDILDLVLGPFNDVPNYDPIDNNPEKEYTFDIDGDSTKIVLKKNQLFSNTTLDIINVGFYPKLLQDFYYFLNNRILYESENTIELELQQKINIDEIRLVSPPDSFIIDTLPNENNNLTNGIQLKTFSVLFKTLNRESEGDDVYFYGAPSFGSRYNQTKMECFPNGTLIKDITDNQAVYNGSARLLWGVPNFGYIPTPTIIPGYSQYFSDDLSMAYAINDNGMAIIGKNIDDLFGTFTFDELELFEQEFLEFAKPANRTVEEFNFQRILRSALQVDSKDFEDADPNTLVEKFQIKQQQNFDAVVNKYINQNYYFQKGNPTNYNNKSYSVFTNDIRLKPKDADTKIQRYKETTPNSVPISGGTLTLADSQTQFSEAWRELQLRVGFLNFDGFNYGDNGSFITDFFPDLNIAFTPEMIERFQDVIKIYATRKWVNSGNTSFDFTKEMTDYLIELQSFRNNIINGIFIKLKNNLPSLSQTSNAEDTSSIEGGQTKLEYYKLFKSINDKWVAGNNYNSETLFEDIMFLDRANRDIGDIVIVDIEKIKNYLKWNPKTPLYYIVNSIALDNKFQMFSLPSYVNFYNVKSVDGTPSEGNESADNEYESANKLFGTYNTVDYQDSKTKLIFMYTETPSEQIQNNNPKNGYLDDSFNIGVPTNNPLVESSKIKEEKKDWGKSNKVVGFSVDFGTQNQGVFTNVQVSQDIGKATSESLEMEYELANVYRGTKSALQNVSLYNIYKSRSYSSTVTAMGNAMIQPTMYFVLRNIPLFSGPYMITEVEHNITESDFKTQIKGTRQKLYTPPIQNPLLQTIKNNYLSKLVNDLATTRETEKQQAQNTIQVRNTISNTISSNYQPSSNPICRPSGSYAQFTLSAATSETAADKIVFDAISAKTSSLEIDVKYTYVVYSLLSVATYKSGIFQFYNKNLSNTPLIKSYGQSSFTYFSPCFVCLNGSDNQSQAFAVFDSIDKCIEFNYTRYKDVFKNININSQTEYVEFFAKTWIEQVPYNQVNETKDLYESYVTTNPTQYQSLVKKIEESYVRTKTYLTTT